MKQFSYYNLILILIVFNFITFKTQAHGGRTDSSGCHNCRTGACAGEYHCHGGVQAVPQYQDQTTTAKPQNPSPSVVPTYEKQDVKPTAKNLNLDKSKNSDIKEVVNKEKVDPLSDFVKLSSILGTLFLGFFIYNIYNK